MLLVLRRAAIRNSSRYFHLNRRAKPGLPDASRTSGLSRLLCQEISWYLAEKRMKSFQEIADFIWSTKALQQIAKFPEYRTALISAAVTGKIDVRAARAV